MKYRDILKLIKKDGWYLISVEGSHRHFKHPTKKGRVTVAGHPGDEIPLGTLYNILKQAEIQKQRRG